MQEQARLLSTGPDQAVGPRPRSCWAHGHDQVQYRHVRRRRGRCGRDELSGRGLSPMWSTASRRSSATPRASTRLGRRPADRNPPRFRSPAGSTRWALSFTRPMPHDRDRSPAITSRKTTGRCLTTARPRPTISSRWKLVYLEKGVEFEATGVAAGRYRADRHLELQRGRSRRDRPAGGQRAQRTTPAFWATRPFDLGNEMELLSGRGRSLQRQEQVLRPGFPRGCWSRRATRWSMPLPSSTGASGASRSTPPTCSAKNTIRPAWRAVI